MTLVEGDRGVIVIDPLISAETAPRPRWPCTGSTAATGRSPAVIYTHSHVDHFGGVRGRARRRRGGADPRARAGFLEHAVAENVYAGGAMNRRAVYMYGA